MYESRNCPSFQLDHVHDPYTNLLLDRWSSQCTSKSFKYFPKLSHEKNLNSPDAPPELNFIVHWASLSSNKMVLDAKPCGMRMLLWFESMYLFTHPPPLRSHQRRSSRRFMNIFHLRAGKMWWLFRDESTMIYNGHRLKCRWNRSETEDGKLFSFQ